MTKIGEVVRDAPRTPLEVIRLKRVSIGSLIFAAWDLKQLHDDPHAETYNRALVDMIAHVASITDSETKAEIYTATGIEEI